MSPIPKMLIDIPVRVTKGQGLFGLDEIAALRAELDEAEAMILRAQRALEPEPARDPAREAKLAELGEQVKALSEASPGAEYEPGDAVRGRFYREPAPDSTPIEEWPEPVEASAGAERIAPDEAAGSLALLDREQLRTFASRVSVESPAVFRSALVHAQARVPGPDCRCGHPEWVHNVVAANGMRGFCAECAGACKRYAPLSLITDFPAVTA